LKKYSSTDKVCCGRAVKCRVCRERYTPWQGGFGPALLAGLIPIKNVLTSNHLVITLPYV
jgi:hypothetical protein